MYKCFQTQSYLFDTFMFGETPNIFQLYRGNNYKSLSLDYEATELP